MVKRKTPYYVSDWRKSEEYNIAEMEGVLKEGKVRLAYLYTAAMDSLLHRRGKDHSDIPKKVAFYERNLKRLLAVARESYEEVDVVIFSDHGMNTIHETVDVMSEIASTGLTFRKDYVAVYDSTMARFWFKGNDSSREKIVRKLKSLNYGRLLTKEELGAWGCYFEDGQYGELFFLLNPGVLMVPSHMGKTPLKGMHGYDPFSPDAYAMMVSNRPIGDGVKGLTNVRAHIESLVFEPVIKSGVCNVSQGRAA
jgi:predicted AlkP superfamily pyrophosphatase or phosphodiesterase